MAAMYALIQKYTNRSVVPEEVCFEHERVGSHSIYEAHFNCNVFFDQTTNYIMFDKSHLDIAAPSISKNLYPIIASHLQNIAASREKLTTLSHQIYSLIDEKMLAEGATLHKVSHTLGLSESTLAHRLKSEGTSFNELLTYRKMKFAERLSMHSNTPIGDVAFSVGYSENASFTRAFKAWSGKTPKQFRRLEK